MDKTQKNISTAIGVFLLLFVAVSVIAFVRRQGNSNQAADKPTPSVKVRREMEFSTTSAQPFPTVTVGKWNILGAAAIEGKNPSTAYVFNLKENLTKSDFTALAGKLGLPPAAVSENGERLIAGAQRGKESAVLYLQKESGAFMYRATDGFGTSNTVTAGLEPQRLQQFVIGFMNDPTVRFSASYKKKSAPNITFYEFKRDEKDLQIPVVSLLGMFNQEESSDPDVIETTDKTDGQARKNTVNTLTVGVKNGKVVSVVSKLRFSVERPDSAQVLKYTDAVKQLEENKYAQILTSPEGKGKLNHEEVYPKDKASLRSVTVTDSQLVYIEELVPQGQSVLVPYYVFKGYGVLTSGYKVNVVAAVAAVPNPKPAAATPSNSNQSSQSAQTQQSRPQTTPGQQVFTAKCQTPPAVSDLSNAQTNKSGTIFGQLPSKNAGKSNNPDVDYAPWYIVPHSVIDVQQFSDLLDSLYSKQAPQAQTLQSITTQYESAAGNMCAILL